MAEVQSPLVDIPESKVGSHDQDKNILINRLDELLEKYLHTLDKYQRVRELLSKQLSSGYLSLAQANFQNRSTTHYGQDNYDERMQAIRKVSIREEADDSLTFLVAAKKEEAEIKNQSDEESKNGKLEKESASTSTATDPDKESEKPAKIVDPLRWFGILVPPALRSAQSSFVAAVEGPVPQLMDVARELRNQEIEIGRVRKQIKKL
ncbi:hypothetical protein HBI25_003070 [Parastagonospora nodorum]|nr:hypothetical protein HBH47_041040 [Parastagonospora nodorum]KAH4213058.1 hypothetical protein HBI95_022250 [Parastagonospora nodorum]KAH4859591.1 hypothetical protein HBH75_043030 [Parastagonospora nodorum]KAH5252653.1 hypothetical protein HBI71_145870 [Parastagonospora nodorum]KAH5337994.1 hypothetical protein HBI12_020230 [Parastagonospora nodorum]